MSDRKNMTVWEKPTHKMQTQYGLVTFHRWIELERQRMREKGIIMEIVSKDVLGETYEALAYC